MNIQLSLEEQTNKYNDLLSRHLKEIPNIMFTFEVAKCCNYSTLVFLYKEDMLCDLFLQVAKHFGCQKLASLYMLDENDNKVQIPFNSRMTLSEFILVQTNAHIFKPIYDLPMPVVYRIYLDDGHGHVH